MKLVSIYIIIFLLSCKSKEPLKIPKGGYDFIEKLNDIDSSFPYYPVRNLENIMDSTYDAFYTKELFKVFNEKNISLRAEKKPLLRITFKDWGSAPFFITIDEEKIVIKHGLGVQYLNRVPENLSEIENFHLSILEMRAPISKRMKTLRPSQKKFLDSLVYKYPELLQEEYYNSLMRKVFIPLNKPFEYSIKHIHFGKSKFQKIINKLQETSFWNLPLELDCYDRPSDGYSFIMEFNGGNKYKIVKFGMCMDKETAFKTVCKEIIKIAELTSEIRL